MDELDIVLVKSTSPVASDVVTSSTCASASAVKKKGFPDNVLVKSTSPSQVT